MSLSTFDLFEIGIGPSSSHTVGPMRAAERFLRELETLGLLERTARVETLLCGSLARPGRVTPPTRRSSQGCVRRAARPCGPDAADGMVAEVRTSGLPLLGRHPVPFAEAGTCSSCSAGTDPASQRHPISRPGRGRCRAAAGMLLLGGGRFRAQRAGGGCWPGGCVQRRAAVPVRLGRGAVALCRTHGRPIAELILEKQKSWRDEARSVPACSRSGPRWRARSSAWLPHARHVAGRAQGRRRAPAHAWRADPPPEAGLRQLTVLDWVNLYALAVNEENAAGGRVVTAPTSGPPR